MIDGACHCGAVTWRIDAVPKSATACNCTICRRYGVLWAYGHEDEDIRASGPTSVYSWGEKSIGFHFCPSCGCVAYWRATAPHEGRRRMAVNLRLADPEVVGPIAIRHFDGLKNWEDLPPDGRCVADIWF